MIKVEKFLGCFKLETGGLLIAWLSLIKYIIIFVACILATIFVSVYTCNDSKDIYLQQETPILGREVDFCGLGGIIRDLIVVLISVGFVVVAYSCIKGISKRDHVRIKPMMVAMAICTILSLSRVLSFDLNGLISAIIAVTIYGYCFVVMYSLYDMLKQENERGATAQPQDPPGGKV